MKQRLHQSNSIEGITQGYTILLSQDMSAVSAGTEEDTFEIHSDSEIKKFLEMDEIDENLRNWVEEI